MWRSKIFQLLCMFIFATSGCTYSERQEDTGPKKPSKSAETKKTNTGDSNKTEQSKNATGLKSYGGSLVSSGLGRFCIDEFTQVGMIDTSRENC